MLIDGDDRFISQRTERRLSQFSADAIGRGVVLSVPGIEPLRIAEPGEDAEVLTVDVWGKGSPVRRAADADAWLSDWLGYPVRMTYQHDQAHRRLSENDRTFPSDRVSLADGYPLLLTSEASLAALNSELDAAVGMLRFRPNVVVRGLDAFAELEMTRFTIGGISFRAIKPCVRCGVITLDPATGEQSKEPLRTMARLPRTRTDGGVIFGMNLVPDQQGEMRVGDPVVAR